MNRSTKKEISLFSRVATIVVAVGWTALAVSSESQSQEADESSVRAVVEGLIAADNAEDLGRVLSFYDDDAVLISPVGADIVGIKDIQLHYEQLFADVDLNIQISIDEIVVSGELAIVRGTNDVVATTANDASRVRSKFLMSLRRHPTGAWRVVYLMWSNQPVPPE